MNFEKRLSAQAIKDWNNNVFSKEDVIVWHRVHTPWFNEQQIELIVKYYDEQIVSIKDDHDQRLNKKDLSQFEQLFLDSQ